MFRVLEYKDEHKHNVHFQAAYIGVVTHNQ